MGAGKANASVGKYLPNDNWQVIHENGRLLLSAGADRLFAIEDVTAETAAEILALCRRRQFSAAGLSPAAAEIFEQLKTAGVVLNKIEPKAKYSVGLQFAGRPDEALRTTIAAQLGRNMILSRNANPDLLLIIRTNQTLMELCGGDYAKISQPHLLIDLAYAHTVSLGPLVFPGDTACLGCLAGRLVTYWGDAEPPLKPAINENRALIAGLVALEVHKILGNYDRSLANRTVAYDFADHQLQSHNLYKLPPCPVCGPGALDTPGSIALPWRQRPTKQ